MEEGSLTNIAFLVIVLGLVTFVGAAIFGSYQSAVIETDTLSTTENITSDNGTATTLSQIPSTLTALHKNTTWLNFSGSDELQNVIDTDELLPDRSLGLSTCSSQNFSISLWINFSNFTLLTDREIWASNEANDHRMLVAMQNGSIFVKLTNLTTQIYWINSTTEINDSFWHNIILTANMTHTLGNFSLWDNGIEIANNWTATDVCLDNLGDFDFGKSIYGGLDEIRMYNRTLGIDEIIEINSSGRTPNSTLTTIGLRAWNAINENSGTTTHDSGNVSSNEGTISGADWDNDRINITMTENTEYTLSGATFTLTEADLSWTQIIADYSYLQNVTSQDSTLARDAEEGLGEFGNWFDIIIIVGIAGVILGLIFLAFGRKEEQMEVSY